MKVGEELKMAKREREEHCQAKAKAEASLAVTEVAMFDLQAKGSIEKKLRQEVEEQTASAFQAGYDAF